MNERTPTAGVAWMSLTALTFINLLNYADRSVLNGMIDTVKADFGASDTEMGVLAASFIFVYSVVAPFTGVLGDRFPRKWFIGVGVLLWSAATVWSGRATSFGELLAARATIGIGEAGYAVMAPSFIADLFAQNRRGRMMAIFYAALPVGYAVGYTIGGKVGAVYGWRSAFYVAGLPGFLAGLWALALPEPKRGAFDGVTAEVTRPTVGEMARRFWRTKSFVICTLGSAAMTFAMGGLAVWVPTYLERERHVPRASAGPTFGLLLVVAGFAATMLGGWLGDHLQKRHRGAYFLVSGVGLALAVPCVLGTALFGSPSLYWPSVFAALFFLFLNTGPLNAALVNVVPASMRATAGAVYVLLIHMLGDAFSPVAIGAISDRWSLSAALVANSVMIALAAVILLLGIGALRRDLDAMGAPDAGPA